MTKGAPKEDLIQVFKHISLNHSISEFIYKCITQFESHLHFNAKTRKFNYGNLRKQIIHGIMYIANNFKLYSYTFL